VISYGAIALVAITALAAVTIYFFRRILRLDRPPIDAAGDPARKLRFALWLAICAINVSGIVATALVVYVLAPESFS